jgi:hypothetical protein
MSLAMRVRSIAKFTARTASSIALQFRGAREFRLDAMTVDRPVIKSQPAGFSRPTDRAVRVKRSLAILATLSTVGCKMDERLIAQMIVRCRCQ